MTAAFSVSLLITLISGGCGEGAVGHTPQEETIWKEVVQFRGVDIRGIIQFKGEIYISAVNYYADTFYNGVLYKSSDAVSWILVNTFNEAVGPMTVYGDTLFIISDNYVYSLDPVYHLRQRYRIPPQIADVDLNGDIVFINNELFVSQTRFNGNMFAVNQIGSWRRITFIQGAEEGCAGAKFLKASENLVFVRPRWGISNSYFYQFDGHSFIELESGLPRSAKGIGSMALCGSVLIAGFSTSKFSSSAIYKWNDGNWQMIMDSLPNIQSAYEFFPPAISIPTTLAVVNNIIYVSTQYGGLFFWDLENGWMALNNGLPINDIGGYLPVSFFENFNGVLLVGYGDGAHTWGTELSNKKRGLYILKP